MTNPTPVSITGMFDLIGVSHDIDIIGKFDVEGLSHPVSIQGLMAASHSKTSVWRISIG